MSQLTQQLRNLWCLCNTFCVMILDISSCKLYCVIPFFRLRTLDIIHTCSKCSREVGTLMCRTLHTKPQTKCIRTDEIFKLKTQIVPFWWHCIHTDVLTKILPPLLYILLLQKWQKMKPQLYRLRWGESHIYSPSSNVICRNSMLHPLHFMQCCTTLGNY